LQEDIAEGDLVMEYVGEVIDGAEVHRRMTAQRQNTPQDKDFYIMELSNGMFVDGKFKGSTSRYINHSCDPNCELQRWVVKGYPRIGIFALRDISAGEALSYDYQFDTNEAETFKCYCGTEKCRGTMAPSKKKQVLFDAQGRPQSKEDRERLILMVSCEAFGRWVIR
jgi:SET domain-containing protein